MEKKNILVICSDEHHPRISGYRGHPAVKTPNLDRLAQRGTAFSSAYCNCPVCTPSRMSFITGRYVHDIGSWFIGVPLDPEEMTWPRRLADAGIPSTMFGKMDFCGPYQSGGFSDYQIIEKRGAYTPYPRVAPLASRLNGYIRPDKREHILHSGPRAEWRTNGDGGHDDRLGFYDHDRQVTDWALEFLRDKGARGSGEPWALYVGLLYPHWPFCVPQKYLDLYPPDAVEWPCDCNIPHNPSLHPELAHFQRAQDLDGVTGTDIRRTISAYCGMVTAMDEMVGEMLGALREQGMEEDTYVIYTSDHGESLGEHGLFYKQCAYEGSVGVPLIVAGPDIPAGKTVDAPVSLVDLYPTVLDMAGLETEDDRPGLSWRKLAKGECPPQEEVFAEYHGNFFRKDWYMLRFDHYKYIYYVDDRPSLFDLEADPMEMIDLALLPAYAGLLSQCEKRLRARLDPVAVSQQSKRDLGLIGPEGEDYTKTLSVPALEEGQANGTYPFQPEFEEQYEGEMV